jgi:tetratricopeptide (TPR) repeat protein
MTPRLALGLLLVACFSLATWTDPRLDGTRGVDKGVLDAFMGEGRKLFANHFYVRSDVYFHSGYYPTIFDQPMEEHENHLAQGAGAEEAKQTAKGTNASIPHGQPGHVHHDGDEKEHHHDGNCDHDHDDEHDFRGRPKDFMDAFSRHFIVSEHTHLTEKGTNGPREILPWLRLAAQLDPNKVETYTVAAYWLRDLGKKSEAEEFLREGLRHNPQSYELLFELGRSAFDRAEADRARNLWELAMTRWREQENPKAADQQNRFMALQIVNSLALLESRAGNRDRAVRWLEIVRKLSPHPAEIDKRIGEVKAGQPLEAR